MALKAYKIPSSRIDDNLPSHVGNSRDPLRGIYKVLVKMRQV